MKTHGEIEIFIATILDKNIIKKQTNFNVLEKSINGENWLRQWQFCDWKVVKLHWFQRNIIHLSENNKEITILFLWIWIIILR